MAEQLQTHASTDELIITDVAEERAAWFGDLWRHRQVIGILVRKDFQTRYKRASLGLLWAVALPLLQAGVMAIVFSKVVGRAEGGPSFGAYLMSGMLVWSYFGPTLMGASTAVVDGANLTDKVWFPRAVLVIVPVLSNLVGFFVSLTIFVLLLPALDSSIGAELVLLVPGILLAVAFLLGAALVLSALHVYFRDVRFIVQAALLVWLYVTPIVYPKSLLGERLATLVDFNPMTGIVTVFRAATVGAGDGWERPVVFAVAVTVALLAVGLEAHRRHDRLFVDLL